MAQHQKVMVLTVKDFNSSGYSFYSFDDWITEALEIFGSFFDVGNSYGRLSVRSEITIKLHVELFVMPARLQR